MKVGDKINRLTLLKIVGKDKWKIKIGEFRCDCGTVKNMSIANVTSGRARSCGCYRSKDSMKVGEKSGRLLLLEIVSIDKRHHKIGNFKCDCGNLLKTRLSSVKSEVTRSCGCLAIEERTILKTKHGLSHLPEYKIWNSMLLRCNDPTNDSYKNYGKRGITVSSEWHEFERFFSDIGLRPSNSYSLDRIDNNNGYSKENCRWATRKEQANNTRRNHLLTAYGVTQTIAEWARTLEVPQGRIIGRLCRNYSVHDALFLPKQPNGFTPKITKEEK